MGFAWWLRSRLELLVDGAFAAVGYVPRWQLESERNAHQLAVEAAVQAHARADQLEERVAGGPR